MKNLTLLLFTLLLSLGVQGAGPKPKIKNNSKYDWSPKIDSQFNHDAARSQQLRKSKRVWGSIKGFKPTPYFKFKRKQR